MVAGQRPFRFLYQAVAGPLLPGTVALCVLAFASQCLETVSTVALRHLVNSISGYAAGTSITPLALGAAAFVGSAAAAAGLSALFLRLDTGVRRHLFVGTERRLFAHVLWHAPAYFEHRLPGEIAHQVRSGTEAAAALFNMFTNYSMRFLAMAVSAALVFWASIPLLNLFTAVWIVAFLGGSYYITQNCAALSRDLAGRSGQVSGRMIDTLRNISAVRAFARQSFEHAYVGGHVEAERQAQAALRMEFYRLFVFQFTCKAILNVLVIGSALWALFDGRIDVGSVVMLITLAALISSLVQEVSGRMYEVFDNFGTLSHALGYVTVAHGIADAPQARPLRGEKCSVQYEDIAFRYATGSFAIDGLNLSIAPGERIGLVGASGAGKSTLLRLLKREYEPARGRILIGGEDIAHGTLASLAELIAEVPQQAKLFNRSIRENIAYGRPGASEAEILRAAGEAQCADLIAARAEGMAASVGEDGANLSGGERQRVLIARAILKNAPILLLDEATSSLDARNEALVQQALARLMAGKTVIAIAHRPSTLEQMDRIVVMAEGRLFSAESAPARHT